MIVLLPDHSLLIYLALIHPFVCLLFYFIQLPKINIYHDKDLYCQAETSAFFLCFKYLLISLREFFSN